MVIDDMRIAPSRRRLRALGPAVIAFAVLLPIQVAAAVTGRVQSGPSATPISGSSVTLWAAGTSYRTASKLASAVSASNGSFFI